MCCKVVADYYVKFILFPACRADKNCTFLICLCSAACCFCVNYVALLILTSYLCTYFVLAHNQSALKTSELLLFKWTLAVCLIYCSSIGVLF